MSFTAFAIALCLSAQNHSWNLTTFDGANDHGYNETGARMEVRLVRVESSELFRLEHDNGSMWVYEGFDDDEHLVRIEDTSELKWFCAQGFDHLVRITNGDEGPRGFERLVRGESILGGLKWDNVNDTVRTENAASARLHKGVQERTGHTTNTDTGSRREAYGSAKFDPIRTARVEAMRDLTKYECTNIGPDPEDTRWRVAQLWAELNMVESAIACIDCTTHVPIACAQWFSSFPGYYSRTSTASAGRDVRRTAPRRKRANRRIVRRGGTVVQINSSNQDAITYIIAFLSFIALVFLMQTSRARVFMHWPTGNPTPPPSCVVAVSHGRR